MDLQGEVARRGSDPGRYRLVKELGRGAMGSVYLAQDTHLQRLVAMKIPHFRPGDSPELLERFYIEACAAATLSHPNICAVYDVGKGVDGIPWLTMAYIEGETLTDLIKRERPLPPVRAVEIIYKLARALEEAHGRSIIHRDLKPANVMMNHRGEPVIMDFGLARRMDQDTRMTHQGSVMGTPAYMTPEQVRGDIEAIGPATDQYSLAVILYELLTGQVPFRGTMGQVMAGVLTEKPRPPRELRPDLDCALEAICLKAMASTVDDRFPSIGAFAQALEPFIQSLSILQHPSATGAGPAAYRPRSNPEFKLEASTLPPPGWKKSTVASGARGSGASRLLNRLAAFLLVGVGLLWIYLFLRPEMSPLARVWSSHGLPFVVFLCGAGVLCAGYAWRARLWVALTAFIRRAGPSPDPGTGTPNSPPVLPRSAEAAPHAEFSVAPPNGDTASVLPPSAHAAGQSTDGQASLAATPRPDAPQTVGGFFPQRLGKYELLRRLGQGETGVVYLARHAEQGWQAALKVLPGARFTSPANLQRLLRMARIGAELRHPNICQILDAGTEQSEFYLVMEYLEGKTLETGVRAAVGGLPLPLTCYYASQIFDALHYLAGRNVVHRDLKPANIMVCAGDRLKLMDLGLAKNPDADAQNLTVRGAILGTPAYMAPEQIADASAATPRSDLYAAGATLFEMVTGTTPFRADSPAVVMQKILREDPPDPRTLRPDLPESLAQVIHRLLARDPAARPAPEEVLQVLRAVSEGAVRLLPWAAPTETLAAGRPSAATDDVPRTTLVRQVERAAEEIDRPDADELLDLLRQGDRARLGNFYLVERIGPKAAVNTYRARHWVSDKPHVVRILPPALGQLAPDRLRDLLGQAARLLEISARSRHLARLLDIGEARVAGGTFSRLYYLVEECVPGKSLEALLDDARPGRPAVVERCLRHAVSGLRALHRGGLLHGHLHPGKFYYDAEARHLRLADLSHAQPAGAAVPGAPSGTINGMDWLGEHAHGHRQYLAPEVFCDGAAPGPLAEQYTLGVIFLELLTGRRLRGHDNDLRLLKSVQEDLQTFLAEARRASPQLGRVLRRMVTIDPGRRYRDLDAVRAAMTRDAAERRPRPPAKPAPSAAARPENDSYHLFISYRRKNGAEAARAIVERLRSLDVGAFMDVNSLDSGPFDEQLLSTIGATPNFIVILSEGSLDRCVNEGDWLRREMAHAIRTRRNIIPVTMDAFQWPEPDKLPGDVRALTAYHSLPYDQVYFDAFIDRLVIFLRRGKGRGPAEA